MAFPKITETLTANKGVTGLPDTPELSAGDMQKKFDELSTDVIIPFVNEHIDLLSEEECAESIGAKPTTNMSGVESNLQAVLEALDNMTHTSISGATMSIDSNGHLIVSYPDGTKGDLGVVALVPKGEFSATVKYGKFVMVSYSNVLYVSIADVPLGTLPTNTTYWTKLFDISASLDAKADKTTVTAIDTRLTTAEGEIEKLTSKIVGVLEAGETSIELVDDSITEDSTIRPIFWVALGVATEPISYATMKVEVGKVTFTFDAFETDVNVGIYVL